MNIIEVSDKVTIHLPDGPIGIIASGGADSSLLLYFLMKYHKHPIHIFTCSSNYKGRRNAVVSSRVVEKCIQLTNNINIIHYKYFVETQTKSNVFDISYDMVNKNQIDCLFTGITANPPYDVISKFIDENFEDTERNPNIKRSIFHCDGKIQTPFTNIDKKHLSSLYKKCDLLETLFPLTSSCEKEYQLEYYDHCGICWWCEERMWGFGRLK